MKLDEHEDNPFYLTEEQLSCKNPVNKHYVRTAYTYAIGFGYRDENHKELIESVILFIKRKQEEATIDEFSQIMKGIANRSIEYDLQDISEELDKGTVDEAIIFLINELRIMRQSTIISNNVNFSPIPEKSEPFQTDEWVLFKTEWYENELRYFKELKALGITNYLDVFRAKINPSASIKLAIDKRKVDEAINIMHNLLNNRLINATYKDFKRLFVTVGKQKFSRIEWTGSQAEIKAFFDLLKSNGLIENQNLNQLAEQCFFSTKHNLIARTLGSVTCQSAYLVLTKEQDQSHILYELIKQLKSLKSPV